MLNELITVTTADGKELDGALYTPPGGSGNRIGVLLVHGLTWSFFRGPARWLPPRLVPHGFTCLSINMRDYDRPEPTDFDLSHHDIRAGIDRLKATGVEKIVLLAHGYGCNKLAVFPAQSNTNDIDCYVLTTVGSIKGYRPDIWDDVVRKASKMNGEVLLIQGALDNLLEPKPRADEFVEAASHCKVDVVLLEKGDHNFVDTKDDVAGCILEWLAGLAKNGRSI